jgi:putative membrane protein
VIYLATRWGRSTGVGETPLDILKKRYAKGELTKEEFDQKKKDLGL